jgi:hypothetical protein
LPVLGQLSGGDSPYKFLARVAEEMVAAPGTVSRAAWSTPADTGTVAHWAGGRRRHNRRRQARAQLRRRKLRQLLTFRHGDVARLARAPGVGRWTVTRDLKAMDCPRGWRVLGRVQQAPQARELAWLPRCNGTP